MSPFQKFPPGQIKHQQSPEQEAQQLRQSLILKAKQLKQKMYQQTSFFDYSVNHLMAQTLKQIKKHKELFKQKEQMLMHEQKNEQSQRKQSVLKNQLIKNLEKCKNRYQKHISSIKNQRNRMYSETNQQSSRQNVQEMLITAKNKFKKEQRQKRNQSEIITVGKPTKHQPIHTHNRTQNTITPKKPPKLYQKLLRVNQDLTYILEDPLTFPQLNEDQIKQINRHKMNRKQIFGVVGPLAQKKIAVQLSPSKKVYYSLYNRFPPQVRQNMNNNQIETSTSDRSAFVPIGKVMRSGRKPLEVNNLTKREQGINIKVSSPHTTKKRLLTEILNEVQEGQTDECMKFTMQKEQNGILPYNSLLSKQSPKALSTRKKSDTTRSKLLTQSSNLQSQKMSRMMEQKKKKQELMFEDVRGTRIITEFTPSFNEESSKQFQKQFVEENYIKEMKIDVQLKGDIVLGDSQLIFGFPRKELICPKPVLFHNSKFKGFNKGTIKNRMRYQDEVRLSQQVVLGSSDKKQSKSINLDVKGNNLKLMQSIKLEKSHKMKGSDFSQTSIM